VAPDWLGDQENAAMLSDRRSTGRFVTSLKLRHLVRLMANTPTALVLLVSEASYAAQRTIEWFSEESCRYKIRFDPKKNDVTRIKNTADFIFSGYLHDFPLSQRLLDLMEIPEKGRSPSPTSQFGSISRKKGTNPHGGFLKLRVVSAPPLEAIFRV
jgi:hypothetical protein